MERTGLAHAVMVLISLLERISVPRFQEEGVVKEQIQVAALI